MFVLQLLRVSQQLFDFGQVSCMFGVERQV